MALLLVTIYLLALQYNIIVILVLVVCGMLNARLRLYEIAMHYDIVLAINKCINSICLLLKLNKPELTLVLCFSLSICKHYVAAV